MPQPSLCSLSFSLGLGFPFGIRFRLAVLLLPFALFWIFASTEIFARTPPPPGNDPNPGTDPGTNPGTDTGTNSGTNSGTVYNGIEIFHKTVLASPDWIFGKRDGFDKNKRPIHGGKTREQDCQRLDVGVGEEIILEINPQKAGFEGMPEEVWWEIIEGDAYFLREGEKSEYENCSLKRCKGGKRISLKIRVEGEKSLRQLVRVRVTTEPISSNSKSITKLGFKASAEIKFTRYRPQNAESFHHWEQHKEGETGEGFTWMKGQGQSVSFLVKNKRFLGAWSEILGFPCPTKVNFGGPAEEGVWILEIDANPSSPINGVKTATVVPENSRLFAPYKRIHKATRKYIQVSEEGFFADSHNFFAASSDEFELYYGDDLEDDHSLTHICDFYYQSGFSAKIHNDLALGIIPESRWRFVTGVEAKFRIHSGDFFAILTDNRRWDSHVEKFKTNAHRSLTGSTFHQVRVHGWCPWDAPDSAPPSPSNHNKPPYSYGILELSK